MEGKIFNETDSEYIIKFKKSEFRVLKPTENNKYLMFIIGDSPNKSWLNKLNFYCISKNPSFNKLLEKFIIMAEKNYVELESPYIKMESSFSEKELAYQIEKNIILKYAEFNNFQSNNINFSKNTKKLFNKEIITDIIINEYMNVWKYLIDNQLGSIDIENNLVFHWKLYLENFKSCSLRQELREIGKKYGYSKIEIHIFFNDKLYPNFPTNDSAKWDEAVHHYFNSLLTTSGLILRDDENEYHPVMDKLIDDPLNVPSDRKIKLLCVSRISKEKNLDVFCSLDTKQYELVLVGDGPYKKELMEKLLIVRR